MERWEKRITPGSLRLTDRLVNFELHILLHLIIKNSGEMWGVCLEPIVPFEPVGIEEVVVVNGKQGTVLVDVIKLVDSPERLIPPFVWPKLIDFLYRQGRHALYFPSLLGFVSSEIPRNRKFDSPARFSSGTNNDELVSKVVKSAPEIVNDVSSRGDCIKGQSWKGNEATGFLSGLSVHLRANYRRGDISSDEKLLSQITEVLSCPLNFYSGENDSIVGRKRHSSC